MRDVIMKEGFSFAFDTQACSLCNGACCRGESGYVWLSKEEIVRIADFMRISKEKFLQYFCKKVRYRYTIKEYKKNGEYFCIFFEEGRGCQIYAVRPKQCKDYPFWERYKNGNNIDEVCQECRGILLL